MSRLYILPEDHFAQIERLRPRDPLGRGRPPKVSDRDALEGVLHALRTGTPWRDLPQDYGPWHTIYMRWVRWIKRGIWENMLKILQCLKHVEMEIVFLDSTIVRAHQHAAGAPKKKGEQAIGRSRGGLTTKIHLLCASESDALEVQLTAGQRNDAPVGEALL